jgi:hypothetical protein
MTDSFGTWMRVKEGGYAVWNGDSIGKKWRSNSLLGAEL